MVIPEEVMDENWKWRPVHGDTTLGHPKIVGFQSASGIMIHKGSKYYSGLYRTWVCEREPDYFYKVMGFSQDE